jgi:hypothetical protein
MPELTREEQLEFLSDPVRYFLDAGEAGASKKALCRQSLQPRAKPVEGDTTSAASESPMPQRPGDPPPRARALTDRERSEAVQLREIVRTVPPLPAVTPPFPSEPPWSAGLAEFAQWLSIRCECRAGGALPLRYLAAAHGWKMPLSDVVGH